MRILWQLPESSKSDRVFFVLIRYPEMDTTNQNID